MKCVIVMRRVVSHKPMPWSHFTNGAFPGSSRAVFGRFLAVLHWTRRDPDGSIFSPHAGPGLLLILTEKKPGPGEKYTTYIKPANSQAGARRGPCRDPPGKRGQYLRDSTQGTCRSPPPYRTLAGAYGILT